MDAEEVDRSIERSGFVELAARLVRIESHPGIARQEEGVALECARWLAERGVESELHPVAPGRPNLIARLAGRGGGRRLVLCGHMDTVPLNIGDPGEGFSGALRAGRLYGRGAADMKGGCAAMCAALVALRASGALTAGEVVLALVADEEQQSLGAEALVGMGLAAEGAIVGEPTGNAVALGHKGLEWLAIELVGRAAHGGDPARGVHAIRAAACLIAAVEERLVPALARRAHPHLGPPTINFGTIHGGDQPSTVPARCTLGVDRRLVPGESYSSAVAEIEELLAEVRAAFPGLVTAVRRDPTGMATLEHVSTWTDVTHPLAEAALGALGRVRGQRGAAGARTGPTAPTVFPAWTDAALLSAYAHIPSIVLGPGELHLAHSPRESVAVAELEEAARIYATTALAFCSGG